MVLLREPDKKFHAVPFIFWSTHATEVQISHAYKLRAYGFFLKGYTYSVWKGSLIRIIEYWLDSKTPSKKQEYEEPQA